MSPISLRWTIVMDKRDISDEFRERLETLIRRSGLSRSAFAKSVGIDRSALSQLLTRDAARLPRAETLLAIAEGHNVSLDWLLGISQDEGLRGELRPSLEIEEGPGDFDHSLLAKWHSEAAGTKIRYVPTGIPDLLRTEAVIDYESYAQQQNRAAKIDEAQFRIDYNRRPETDMEVCVPVQTIDALAKGQGVWSDLKAELRTAQLRHMANLLDELYPTFRLYLFDGVRQFSVPYTIFGQKRVCIYVGGMYLVLNGDETIKTLTRHFGGLIRGAVVNAHEVAAHVRHLPNQTEPRVVSSM